MFVRTSLADSPHILKNSTDSGTELKVVLMEVNTTVAASSWVATCFASAGAFRILSTMVIRLLVMLMARTTIASSIIMASLSFRWREIEKAEVHMTALDQACQIFKANDLYDIETLPELGAVRSKERGKLSY